MIRLIYQIRHRTIFLFSIQKINFFQWKIKHFINKCRITKIRRIFQKVKTNAQNTITLIQINKQNVLWCILMYIRVFKPQKIVEAFTGAHYAQIIFWGCWTVIISVNFFTDVSPENAISILNSNVFFWSYTVQWFKRLNERLHWGWLLQL